MFLYRDEICTKFSNYSFVRNVFDDYEKAPLTEANEVYKEFCTARGLEYVPLTETDRQERVYKEWIRELIGEGQNFFTYKRLNVRNMIFGISECSEEQYILPIPEKEYLGE